MTLRGGDPTDIICLPNEPLIITIVEQATARIVVLTLNGTPLAGNQFHAGASKSVTILNVGLGFSGNKGLGRYDVTLIGQGPDLSFLAVPEPPAPKLRNIPYTISVP